MEAFQQEINKKIEMGALVELMEEEEKEILRGTHHFSYLSDVSSETPTSTNIRLINIRQTGKAPVFT